MSSYNLRSKLTNIIENAYIRYGEEDILQNIKEFLFTYKDQIGKICLNDNATIDDEYVKDSLISIQEYIFSIMRNIIKNTKNYFKINKFFYAIKDFVLLFVKYIANNYKTNNKLDIDETHELIIEKIELLNKINELVNMKTNLYKDYIQKQQNHYKIDNVNKECSICYNCDENNECKYVQLNKCKHTFHIKCIKEWFEIKNNCPLCRETYEH